MKASELIAALTAKIALHGDGAMVDVGGWDINAIDCVKWRGKFQFYVEHVKPRGLKVAA